jgi:hypothetical protein
MGKPGRPKGSCVNSSQCDSVRCFGWRDGECRVLLERPQKEKCPFYKTDKQLKRQQAQCEALIEAKYGMPYKTFAFIRGYYI